MERPPSHLTAQTGDCRIWEQCLELLSSHDVIFVSADGDFRSLRNREALHPQLREEADTIQGTKRTLTFHPGMEYLLSELKSEIGPIPDDDIFEFVYGENRESVQELQSNSNCQPTRAGAIKQTRLATEACDVIEVRLEVEDRWKSHDGSASLRFEMSGSCRYHLGEKRFADLRTDVFRLLTTGPDGSIRSVKGGHVNIQVRGYMGTPPIEPGRGTLG